MKETIHIWERTMCAFNLADDYTQILLFDVLPSELERLVGEGAYALSAKLASTAMAKLLNAVELKNKNLEEAIKNTLGDIILNVEKTDKGLEIYTKVGVSNEAQEGALAGLFVGLLRAMGYRAVATRRTFVPYKGIVAVRAEGNKVIINFSGIPH